MGSGIGARPVGQRVRELRRVRRLSLETAAGLAGMSRSMLSYIERGERALERRSHIEGLAYALRVSPSELLGQPYPPYQARDQVHANAQAYIDAIRNALVGCEIGYAPDPARRSAEDLMAMGAKSGADLHERGDHRAAASDLAEVLTGLHAYTVAGVPEGQQVVALRSLTLACCTATALAKEIGYLDLSWIAAERARQAAARLDDPVFRGVAELYVGYALESHQRDLVNTKRAIADLQPHVGDDRTAMQVYGNLHLRAAYCCGIFGTNQDVRTHLDEASDLAARTGDGTDFHLFFGPTNMEIWRVSIAVEMGEGGRAVKDTETACAMVGRMPTTWRQAMFHTDLGRAFAQERRDSDALTEFLAAEALAPVYVRNNPFARSAVLDVRDRTRRAAVARDLSALVYRMGLT